MIDPKHLTLAKLLEGRLFRIPEYQRAYSWTTRERGDLFKDIAAVMQGSDGDMTHFMATVVVLRRERKRILADEFEVWNGSAQADS